MPRLESRDAWQRVQRSQEQFHDKFEDLRALSDDTQVMLQQMGEKQTLFVQAAAELRDMQSLLAKQISELRPDPGRPVIAPAAARAESPHERALVQLGSSSSLALPNGDGPPRSDLAWWDWALTQRSHTFSADDLLKRHHQRVPRCGEVNPLLWLRFLIRRVVNDPIFDAFAGIVILGNAVSIGVEIDMELKGQDTRVVIMMEYFFIGFYIFELFLRFLADGLRCLRNGWIFFDFILVVIGASSIFVARPLVANLPKDGASSEVARGVDQVMILRMVRFLRLARALRILSFFKSLWKLVLGFIHSFNTIISTLLFMGIAIYVFSCIGVELITKDADLRKDPTMDGIVSQYFSSIPNFMLTLIQFATLDSISAIYFPLITSRPWLTGYFIPIILILSIAVMNLVTALIVEDALASTSMDNESRNTNMRRTLKKMIPVIKQVFVALDTSGDGSIQIPEIIAGIKEEHVAIPPELAAILTPDKLVDLFDFLDMDGSGELSEVEFVDGVCHLALMTVPVETTQILQLLRHQRRELGLMRKEIMSPHMRRQTTTSFAMAARV